MGVALDENNVHVRVYDDQETPLIIELFDIDGQPIDESLLDEERDGRPQNLGVKLKSIDYYKEPGDSLHRVPQSDGFRYIRYDRYNGELVYRVKNDEYPDGNALRVDTHRGFADAFTPGAYKIEVSTYRIMGKGDEKRIWHAMKMKPSIILVLETIGLSPD